jgi:hypothetical protein
MSVIIDPYTCSNNPADLYLQQYRFENLKSRVKLFFYLGHLELDETFWAVLRSTKLRWKK